jgi:hypothetical protein
MFEDDDVEEMITLAQRNHIKNKNHKEHNEENRHARIRRKAILEEDDEDWRSFIDR